MNHLEGVTLLRNRYFVMRHGFAESNQLAIIQGDPVTGMTSYGLVQKGIDQVRSSIQQAINSELGLDRATIIFSSDFLRAKQTAEIAQRLLGVSLEINFAAGLRERYFGEIECASIPIAAPAMREHDRLDVVNSRLGVETPSRLLERMSEVVLAIEKQHANATVLIISHGDPIKALELAAAKLPPAEFHLLKTPDNAEIRELCWLRKPVYREDAS